MSLLVYDIKSAIGNQRSRNLYAVLCLVVLKQRSYDTRQGECRAVKGVTKLCLLCLSITITTLQTVCLVCVEVRYRRYLEPTFLCFGIYLKVLAYIRCKRLVATAEKQYAVGQLQLLQESFYVCKHFLVTLLRVLGLVDTYYLYL